MDAEFWHQRWQTNEIGFHEPDVNPLLAEHFDSLELTTGSRILVPLCGKSHDLSWLASHGHEVIGVELSSLAVDSFFREQQSEPTITAKGELTAYRAANIEILVGDFFDVTTDILGTIHAIYDRAALVALPLTMRHRYTKHLMDITGNARQLLINYEYDPSLMEGPPFSISDKEIIQHYGTCYDISLLKSQEVESKLKGNKATEKIWLLKKTIIRVEKN